MEFVAPEFAAICAAPAPVSDHVASSLAVTTTTAAPVIGYVAPTTPAPVIEKVAVSPAVTNDGPLPVNGYVAPTAPAPVIENVPVSPSVTSDGPLSVIGYVAPAAPAPVIENVAVSPAVTNDGLLPAIEFMAPALGASYGGPATVTEYVAPDDGPAPDIDCTTRYLNVLQKQSVCPPTILDLESRVAALRQARGH